MARRFLLTAAAAAAVSLSMASPFAAAQAVGPIQPPTVENSRNSAECVINADNVYVRSGAGDNYYPTMKLNKGAKVIVIGEKFDWLKIVPPEGSFSYVGKHFIERTGPNAGRVHADRTQVNVRAGSALNAIKTTVQGQLQPGQEVKILDEVDEYFKIAPPPDAALYVKKDLVDVVRVMPQVANTEQQPQPAKLEQTPPAPTAVAEKPASDGTTIAPPAQQPLDQPPAPTAEQMAAGNATTQPANEQVAAGNAPATTQPTAEVKFDKLEADFETASGKPIEQQPVGDLLKSYEQLVKDPQLPESMRRVADYRAQTLKARAEAREQFLAMQKQQEETRKKIEALAAEREEIAQQIEKNDVKIYAAVGTLRTSSLQNGGGTLYRLTDPQNGRTVCYIRSDDPAYGGMIGQFIGVNGELSTDGALGLKVIAPTDSKEVDPNMLFRGIAAQIVPPSLLPQGAVQASGSGE